MRTFATDVITSHVTNSFSIHAYIRSVGLRSLRKLPANLSYSQLTARMYYWAVCMIIRYTAQLELRAVQNRGLCAFELAGIS